MSPVEFSPQFASSTSFEQSEAASAGDADIEPVAPTISAKAATFDNRMVELLVSKNAGVPAYNHAAIASLRKRFAFGAGDDGARATPFLPRSSPGAQSSPPPFPC